MQSAFKTNKARPDPFGLRPFRTSLAPSFADTRDSRVNVMTKLVIYLTVCLLFLPKINVVAIEGFRAGLRIDDLVIAFAVIYLVAVGMVTQMARSSIFFWGGAFVLTSFLSHLIGGHELFSLRMLEYLCVVLIAFAFGSIVKEEAALAKLLFCYLVVNTVLCILQSAGLVGGIGIAGFTDDFGGRAFGLCNGPWELGIVVCLTFGYLAYSTWIRQRIWRLIIIFAASGITLVLTAARTPLAIFLVLSMLFVTEPLSRYLRFTLRLGVPALALALMYYGVWAIETENFAVVRMREFLNMSNLEDLYKYAVNFRPTIGYLDTSSEELARYKEAGMDPSMAIRLNIFSYLASNYYFGGPIAWLIGIGHGHAGPSTDMGVVRIMAEVGLLGFICFHMMLYRCAQILPISRLAIAALLINQLTLDVYVGYKTMFMFFLIVGFEFASKHRLGMIPQLAGPAGRTIRR
jgi:hypothetical protein